MTRLQRMWINAPSTHQPDHALHGIRVLAGPPEPGRPVTRVWFLRGDVINSEVMTNALSLGWPSTSREGGPR